MYFFSYDSDGSYPRTLAHEKLCSFGILHRDISPGNVFLVSKPEILPKDLKTGTVGALCDFDCAKAKFDEILVPSSETHEVYTSERFLSDGILKLRLVDRLEQKHIRFQDAVAVHRGVEFTVSNIIHEAWDCLTYAAREPHNLWLMGC